MPRSHRAEATSARAVLTAGGTVTSSASLSRNDDRVHFLLDSPFAQSPPSGPHGPPNVNAISPYADLYAGTLN